ncbi:hypothetical protein MTR_5g025030 [Medicago truncatula]|uniref:Uncharacterized protein n=1 Tax=Medicago truncatula TaxID=3880 RepID=G7K2N5_MEDTR|nr:hypothetical protein MTR_5g025030 [Medicago truncatula]
MIHTDVTISRLKDQLDQINRQLNHKDTRRVDDVEYRHPSTDSARSVWFSRMKLMNDDDLDTLLVRSVEQIHKSLIRPRNYEEIMALLDTPDEDISLADS